MQDERPDIYLAKLMCKRQGKKKNIALSITFWNDSNWKLEFKTQIMAANRLMKIYPFEVICSSVGGKNDWIYSLNYPGLKKILHEENIKFETKKEIQTKIEEKKKVKVEVESKEEAPPIIGKKKTLGSKLD